MKSFTKKNIFLLLIAILPFSVLHANPGFSRQMDMNCMVCHNQTMSQLNTFGRKFAASGFTMTSGNQSMIDGDTIKLGLPSALNAGVLLKARYQQSNPEDDGKLDVGADRGDLEMYKVSKLFFGGKIAEHVGGLGAFSYDSFGAKVALTDEFGSGYAGVSGFMSDRFGPFSGGEYFNTGLYPPLKLFENRKGTNAAQATDIGHGPATGIQAYYGGDVLYISAGVYVPATSQHTSLDIGGSGIGVGRIAVAPTFGELTVMVGAYGLSGTATLSDDALNNDIPTADGTPPSELLDITREAFGLDMQVEGKIGGISTVLVLNAVLQNRTRLYNASTGQDFDDFEGLFTDGKDYKAGDNSAFSAELQVNPWAPFGVKLAYLDYDDKYDYKNSGSSAEKLTNKQDRREYTLGLDYSFRQNVRFAFEYTYSDIRINDIRSNEGDLQSLPDSQDFLVYTVIGF